MYTTAQQADAAIAVEPVVKGDRVTQIIAQTIQHTVCKQATYHKLKFKL